MLLFLLALLGITVIRASHAANGGGSRAKCASNLRQFGQSIQIYANENKGAFPRTLFSAAPNPPPTWYTGVNATNPFGPGGPGPDDVTASLYLLIRGGDIDGEVFICPSMWDGVMVTPWAPPAGTTVKSFSNFGSRANLTYGYTNPYPSQAAKALGYKLNYTLSSDFAIAADMGPGPAAAKVAANASAGDMAAANSPNHHIERYPAGQNVLYADGHVDWSSTVFCGSPRPVPNAPRDNIYAFGADTTMTAPSAGTAGAAQDQYDSVILPSADLGLQPGPLPMPRKGVPVAMLAVGAFGIAGLVAVAVVLLLMAVKKKSTAAPGSPTLPPVP